MNKNPSYSEAIHLCALNIVGTESNIRDKYLVSHAVAISLIFEANRPQTYELLKTEYYHMCQKWQSTFTITVED
jgi:hypothetical protein